MKTSCLQAVPNPVRVCIARAETGAAGIAEFTPVDVISEEHRTSEFRMMNPDAVVCCQELEGRSQIARCNAITGYIGASFNRASLMGVVAKLRAQIALMNARDESNLLDAVAANAHPATVGLVPDLEVCQCVEWGNGEKKMTECTKG